MFTDVIGVVNGSESFTINDFQAISFTGVTVLEYIYPICYFCFFTPVEIGDLYTDFNYFT